MDEARLSAIEERRAALLNWFDDGGPVPLKAPLIALVDEDVPALIAEVRRLREEVEMERSQAIHSHAWRD